VHNPPIMMPELKPYLTALVMPPALPLLVVLAGLALTRRRRRVGLALAWLGALSLWVLSALIPSYPSAQAASLQQAQVQAIVTLGGGVETGLADGVALLKCSSMKALPGKRLITVDKWPICGFSGIPNSFTQIASEKLGLNVREAVHPAQFA
jgi:uncharacterized SAM-binding protein YcdF (DUF218 family)